MCSRKEDYNTANNYGFGNEDQYSSLNNGGQRLQVNNFEKVPCVPTFYQDIGQIGLCRL